MCNIEATIICIHLHFRVKVTRWKIIYTNNNSSWPRIEPWAIPHFIMQLSDSTQSIKVFSVLFVRYKANQFRLAWHTHIVLVCSTKFCDSWCGKPFKDLRIWQHFIGLYPYLETNHKSHLTKRSEWNVGVWSLSRDWQCAESKPCSVR